VLGRPERIAREITKRRRVEGSARFEHRGKGGLRVGMTQARSVGREVSGMLRGRRNGEAQEERYCT
jgi:hypothetical protein